MSRNPANKPAHPIARRAVEGRNAGDDAAVIECSIACSLKRPIQLRHAESAIRRCRKTLSLPSSLIPRSEQNLGNVPRNAGEWPQSTPTLFFSDLSTDMATQKSTASSIIKMNRFGRTVLKVFDLTEAKQNGLCLHYVHHGTLYVSNHRQIVLSQHNARNRHVALQLQPPVASPFVCLRDSRAGGQL